MLLRGSAQDINGRRWAIVQQVRQHGQVSVTELSQQLGMSQASIRRDLAYLEEVGLLRRTHGGAEPLAGGGRLFVFDGRLLQNAGPKRVIGKTAAQCIRPGNTILLDSGTTVLEIARNLEPRLLEGGGLTVITRSLAIASEFRLKRQVRLICLGGLYLHDFDTFVGPQVRNALQEIHVDILFTGTDGVTPEVGLTTDNLLEAELHRLMAQRADRVVVVTDSSKIGVNNLQTIFTLDEIHTFITDAGAPAEFLKVLRERNIEVVVVPKPGEQ